MKTKLQKPAGLATPVWAGLMALALSFLLPGFSFAQPTFNPSVLTEYPYPFPGPVTTTTHSGNYTMGHIAYMTNNPTPPPTPPYVPAPPTVPLSDLTLHTWDDAGVSGGIAYLNTATGSGTPAPPPMIYDQGFIPYPPSVRDIEVSLQQDEMGYANWINGTNAAWYVIVSYYNANGIGGPGHYMDVYIWNQPPPNGPGGLSLVSTTQLSTVPHFTRISQDAHNTYAFCITWEDNRKNTNGINFVFGFMNSSIPGPSISPVYVLPGTAGETHPDVAITHSFVSESLQFLYYHIAGGNLIMTESTIPMQFGPLWTAPTPPTIRDVNTISFPCALPDLKTRIDASDHWTDDYAYSYILPPSPCGSTNTDIYVRYNNAGTSTTYDLTDGSMGNVPCDLDPAGNSWRND